MDREAYSLLRFIGARHVAADLAPVYEEAQTWKALSLRFECQPGLAMAGTGESEPCLSLA